VRILLFFLKMSYFPKHFCCGLTAAGVSNWRLRSVKVKER